MTRDAFLTALGNALLPLPQAERAAALNYYREYIDDAVEAGRREEDVVASLDGPAQIAGQLRAESAFALAARAPTPRNNSRAVAAVFGVLSLPITLPLGLALIAVTLALIAAAVAVTVGVLAAVVGAVVMALAFGAYAVALLVQGAATGGAAVFMTGAGFAALGVSVFLAALLIAVSAGMSRGLGRFFRWVGRKVFRRKSA